MNKKQWIEDMQRDFYVNRMIRQGLMAGGIVVVLIVIMNVIYN